MVTGIGRLAVNNAAVSSPHPSRSPYVQDVELCADLPSKAVIDLRMTWDGNLRAVCGVREDAVASAFACQCAAMTEQMIQKLVPFHRGAVPA
jgi:hypothetical protein